MESAFIPWKKYLFYGLSALLFIFSYSWITSPLVITVTGLGEVSIPAENAVVTFSMAVSRSNPDEATKEVKNNVNRVKESLQSLSIGDSDIYVSQATVTPQEDGNFISTVSMGLKLNQITNLDTVTSSLYGLGAVQVSQPQLSVNDSKKLEQEAYDIALKDAKSKASAVALKNLKLFRKIVLIQESQTPVATSITKEANSVDEAELNVTEGENLIKFSKVLSVSYKMW